MKDKKIYLGINLWNWSKELGSGCTGLPAKISAMGFTGIELPMTQPDIPEELVQELRGQELAVTLCASLKKGMDLSSFEAEERRAALEYLTATIRAGSEIGASTLCGALYTGGGKCRYLCREERKREWDLAVSGIRKLAAIADEYGMKLALEPLNHFRTSVCNTSGQILEMVADIGESNVGLHFDTFHACLEEYDLMAALERALKSGRLFHVHAVANNRGAPGQGILPWNDIFSALAENYKGHITMETFAYGALDSSYFRVFGTPDEQAEAGIRYMTDFFAAYEKRLAGKDR